MLLDYALHPKLNTQYFFPRRQADLTSPNARHNSAFIVPGGGGPINPKGAAPFDREPNIITYQFQINPYADGRPADAQRDDFMVAIDHGLPQMLAFKADSGSHWFAQCMLTGDPHHQTAQSDVNHVIEASWLMLSDYIQSPATPGTAVYGKYVKYGNHATYGAKADKLPLTAVYNAMLIDNTLATTGATAPTTDCIVTLTGPFGSTDPAHYPIRIYCLEAVTGFSINRNLQAGDYMEINLTSRRVLFTPAGSQQPQPAFQSIAKMYPTASYLMLLPDQYNSFVVDVYPGGPMLTPNANSVATLQWKPKRSL
jgi:hypothetical protein